LDAYDFRIDASQKQRLAIGRKYGRTGNGCSAKKVKDREQIFNNMNRKEKPDNNECQC